MDNIRIGIGYDIHRFMEFTLFEKGSKSLYLGGVLIEDHVGVSAHSDGDVVLHSLTDAILGALALPDIGALYPDNLKTTEGIKSADILKHAYGLVKAEGFRLINADIVVITQTPKISAYKDRMRESIAGILRVDKSHINIKGKTKEGLDAVGKQKGIECHCVCLLSS